MDNFESGNQKFRNGRNMSWLSACLALCIILVFSLDTVYRTREVRALPPESGFSVSVSSVLKSEAAKISDLQPGNDYVPNEGYFLADSEESARNVAKEYHASLLTYDNGVATVDFGQDAYIALLNASVSTNVDAVIYPDYLLQCHDMEGEETDASSTWDSGTDAKVFNIVNSDNINSDAVSSDMISSNIVDSDAVSSDVLNSDVANSGSTSSDVINSDTVSSEAISSDTVDSDTPNTYSDNPSSISPDEVTGNSSNLIKSPSDDSQFSLAASQTVSDPDASLQWFHEALNDNDAWKYGEGEGVTIAVIDTGICTTHEDLKNNIQRSAAAGFSSSEDDHGHGSHCSGIIAAVRGNVYGGYGIAPKAKIYSIKVADYMGQMRQSGLISGIRAAINENVDIINMSLGSTIYSSNLETVINEADEKGIVCVASAGNDGLNQKNYPAAYSSVLAVAASTKTGSLASYSNYGNWVDITAPGGETKTKVPSDRIYSTDLNNSYSYKAGTSMACPMAAGVAALVLSSNPALMNSDTPGAAAAVREVMRNSSVGDDFTYGTHSAPPCIDAALAAENAKTAVIDDTIYRYALLDSSMTYSNHGTGYICAGKKVLLRMVVVNDNKRLSYVSRSRDITWDSDNPSISVKNGIIKCSSAATPGTQALINATYNGSKCTWKYTIVPKTTKIGWVKKLNTLTGKGTIKSKATLTISQGTALVLSDTDSLLSRMNDTAVSKAITCYNIRKKRLNANYGLSKGNYRITMSGKKQPDITETLANGSPNIVHFNDKGKYRFTYKVADGSNAKFKLTVKVQ